MENTDERTEEIEEEVTENDGGVENEEPKMVRLPDGTEVAEDELLKGYMRQSDYTRKTTSLADQRKELQSKLAQAEEFQAGVNYYWQSNPEEYQKMVDFYQSGQQTEQEPAKADNPDKAEEKKETTKYVRDPAYDARLERIERERVEEQVTHELDTLQREHEMTNAELDELTAVAQDSWNEKKSVRWNLQNAFRTWDYDNGLKKSQLQAEKRRIEKMQAGVGGRSHGGGQKSKSDGELVREVFFSRKGRNKGFRL
jgi:hypothetical protein